jgi:hypothetical protein
MSHVAASVSFIVSFPSMMVRAGMSIQDKIDRLILPGQRQSPLSVAIGYRDKLDKVGPWKLLACDGGGIRGIISIEVLAWTEAELRKTSGNPNSFSRTILIMLPAPAKEQISRH